MGHVDTADWRLTMKVPHARTLAIRDWGNRLAKENGIAGLGQPGEWLNGDWWLTNCTSDSNARR